MLMWVPLLLLVVAAYTGRCQDLAEPLETAEQEKATLRTYATRLSRFPRDILEPETEQLPSNCLEARQTHPYSGIQTLQVATQRIRVYCDQTTDGGGWTVIQRRQDGSVDFYRNRVQYENGFGNLSGEFWLGLHNIHEMTKSSNYSLRVDLWDKNGTHVYAQYSSFYIDGPVYYYTLHLGGYSGTAGDSMLNAGPSGYANNMPFSAYDLDVDLRVDANCAYVFGGGWWYNSCFEANLNGWYWSGIVWYKYGRAFFAKTEMKIRPVNN